MIDGLIRWSLHNKIITISFFFAVMFVTFGAIGGGIIRTQFFPFIERDNINISLDGFKTYYSPRTELTNGKLVKCTDGGVVLFVSETLNSYVVRDHTTDKFPEVVAVEFRGSLFDLESNVNEFLHHSQKFLYFLRSLHH